MGFRDEGFGLKVYKGVWGPQFRVQGVGFTLTYQTPTFLEVLMINPNMDFIGTLLCCRFW